MSYRISKFIEIENRLVVDQGREIKLVGLESNVKGWRERKYSNWLWWQMHNSVSTRGHDYTVHLKRWTVWHVIYFSVNLFLRIYF